MTLGTGRLFAIWGIEGTRFFVGQRSVDFPPPPTAMGRALPTLVRPPSLDGKLNPAGGRGFVVAAPGVANGKYQTANGQAPVNLPGCR